MSKRPRGKKPADANEPQNATAKPRTNVGRRTKVSEDVERSELEASAPKGDIADTPVTVPTATFDFSWGDIDWSRFPSPPKEIETKEEMMDEFIDDMPIDGISFAAAVKAYNDAKAYYRSLHQVPYPEKKKDALHATWRAGNVILDLPAPDLEGVIAKLMYVWYGDLNADTVGSARRCRVIGDLRRIISQADD